MLLLVASLLAGCAAQRQADEVVIASGTDLESANPLVTVHPLSRQIQRYALFVTLVRYDSALHATPYYARSWSWSPDRTTLTLALDPTLAWHDGVPTTAHDVEFTLRAASDAATGYARRADVAAISRVRVVNDTVIELRFDAPQADVPQVLCELPIVPAHLLKQTAFPAMRSAAFNFSPIGNGPFVFASRTAGQRWTFERNERFPVALGGPPSVKKLVVAVVDEPTTKFAGLASGELDFAGVSPTMASLVRDDPSLRLLTYPVLFVNTLVFNTTKPPWSDARVRRAIWAAIDRQRIISAAIAGYATPAGGPVFPGDPRYAPAAFAQDTVLANALLDSAGLRRGPGGARLWRGTPLRMSLLTVGSGDNAVEQLIQADLAARGIGVDIRQVELGAFLTAARQREKTFDALVTGIPGDLSLAFVDALFRSDQAGGSLDYAGYHTPRLDSLLGAARRATPQDQPAAWALIQSELAHEAPIAWLYYSRGVQGASRRVDGVTMDLRGELPTVARWRVRQDSR